MVSCMVARVGPHADVAGLAEHSTVPVINALSDDFHPLQTIADFLTIHEAFAAVGSAESGLGLEGRKVAWVGDSNNVLFDLATACVGLGVDIAVASPPGYGIPERMREIIQSAAGNATNAAGKLIETTVPEEAIKDADILVTDTWVSMARKPTRRRGWRHLKDTRLRTSWPAGAEPNPTGNSCTVFHGIRRGGRHCLLRPSIPVFPEAANRLWAAVGESRHTLAYSHNAACPTTG